jgi:hypothetical protein
MSVVICRLPNAGLGNQLFPLMRAFTFGHLNGLPVEVVNYRQFNPGAYFRNEKSKRNYDRYFTFERGFVWRLWREFALRFNGNIIEEPRIAKLEGGVHHTYIFHKMPHWVDYFEQLKDHRELVVKLFWNTLDESVMRELSSLKPPCIGVHVRKGDFRKLKEGEDFKKVGAVRTPEKYFVDTIQAIRKMHGEILPVSIFTDGYTQEFDSLLGLENVSVVEGNRDIVDLLLLSRSQVIVTSAGSTFSYWAAFLSNAPVVMHPDHIHKPLRPHTLGDAIYEGEFVNDNPVLVSNIRSIRTD